ncbi:hypothetical protein B0H13DRAFT_1880175 [Mycena leptocephala]|nr:hypothetical protein B0H13DRAFT_1880175 [Mycena leptocephala]
MYKGTRDDLLTIFRIGGVFAFNLLTRRSNYFVRFCGENPAGENTSIGENGGRDLFFAKKFEFEVADGIQRPTARGGAAYEVRRLFSEGLSVMEGEGEGAKDDDGEKGPSCEKNGSAPNPPNGEFLRRLGWAWIRTTGNCGAIFVEEGPYRVLESHKSEGKSSGPQYNETVGRKTLDSIYSTPHPVSFLELQTPPHSRRTPLSQVPSSEFAQVDYRRPELPVIPDPKTPDRDLRERQRTTVDFGNLAVEISRLGLKLAECTNRPPRLGIKIAKDLVKFLRRLVGFSQLQTFLPPQDQPSFIQHQVHSLGVHISKSSVDLASIIPTSFASRLDTEREDDWKSKQKAMTEDAIALGEQRVRLYQQERRTFEEEKRAWEVQVVLKELGDSDIQIK